MFFPSSSCKFDQICHQPFKCFKLLLACGLTTKYFPTAFFPCTFSVIVPHYVDLLQPFLQLQHSLARLFSKLASLPLYVSCVCPLQRCGFISVIGLVNLNRFSSLLEPCRTLGSKFTLLPTKKNPAT